MSSHRQDYKLQIVLRVGEGCDGLHSDLHTPQGT